MVDQCEIGQPGKRAPGAAGTAVDREHRGQRPVRARGRVHPRADRPRRTGDVDRVRPDRRERRGPRRAVPRQPAPDASLDDLDLGRARSARREQHERARRPATARWNGASLPASARGSPDSGNRQTDVVPRSVTWHSTASGPSQASASPPSRRQSVRSELLLGPGYRCLPGARSRAAPPLAGTTHTDSDVPHGSPHASNPRKAMCAPVRRPCRRAAAARQCRDLDRHLAAGRVDREDPRPSEQIAVGVGIRHVGDAPPVGRPGRSGNRPVAGHDPPRPRACPGRRDPQVRMPVDDARAVEPPVDPSAVRVPGDLAPRREARRRTAPPGRTRSAAVGARQATARTRRRRARATSGARARHPRWRRDAPAARAGTARARRPAAKAGALSSTAPRVSARGRPPAVATSQSRVRYALRSTVRRV